MVSVCGKDGERLCQRWSAFVSKMVSVCVKDGQRLCQRCMSVCVEEVSPCVNESATHKSSDISAGGEGSEGSDQRATPLGDQSD
jgi:hypothetical protein